MKWYGKSGRAHNRALVSAKGAAAVAALRDGAATTGQIHEMRAAVYQGLCPFCRDWYLGLANHIAEMHDIKAAEWRDLMGLTL